MLNGPSHIFEFGNDTMLIFPSYLRHKVVKHESPVVRKSLAMNFLPQGLLGEGTTEVSLGDLAEEGMLAG